MVRENSWGCLPLCERCWAELTPEARLPFYRALYDAWLDGMTPGLPAFETIKDAVLREGER